MSFFRKACLYTMNLYNFQENLFLFSRNFTIWIGLQLASQSDSFQALGSCFCDKYIKQMCHKLKPSGNCGCDVQVKALLKIMCAQLAEIKGTVLEVKGGLERVESGQDAVVVTEKAGQYSRRNTVVLSGPELEEGETSVQQEFYLNHT